MKTFTASRLVSGNRIFPTSILIDDKSVTVKIPGLFSGKEQTIPFTRISSVKVECPFVGYSTIIIATTGEGEINAHGFLKSEVEEMKMLILDKIQ